VKLSVLPSARTDIRKQIEYYLELDLPHVADRFQLAVNASIRAALQRPNAGSPRPRFHNSALSGLRTWGVRGFDQFRIYYLVRSNTLVVVRILHDKRDVGAILEKQTIVDPDAD
jgi:plasmid stabilization system protein ParE